MTRGQAPSRGGWRIFIADLLWYRRNAGVQTRILVGAKMLKEFRDFIAKGNVMDMAVGIIVGAAFTAIVGSLVADLINPIISLFTGGIDFSNMMIQLSDDPEAGAFKYGSFIMAVINFLIVAWVVFMLVKMVNKVKNAASKPEAPAVPAAPKGPTQEELLIEIRDLLKK